MGIPNDKHNIWVQNFSNTMLGDDVHNFLTVLEQNYVNNKVLYEDCHNLSTVYKYRVI